MDMVKKVDAAQISSQSLRYYWFFIVAYVVFQLVSDVTAAKIISLGPAVVSVTVLYFPITYLISDILTEVYGFSRARRALWLVVVASVTAGLIYQLVVALPPGPGFAMNEAYTAVFSQVPRVLVGGWIAVFVGDIANNYVMSKLKIAFEGRLLWVRTITSTVVGQGLNTALFYVIALWGILPTDVLLQAVLWGWLIKVSVEALLTPLTYYVVSRLKRAERIDAYDYSENYRVFKV